MKACTLCSQTLPATKEYFYGASKGKYGVDSRCKPCASAYNKHWLRKNGSRQLNYQKDRRRNLADWVDTFKNVPCADCGQEFPPYCMDFDHLPEHEKLAQIPQLVSRRATKQQILSEIEKCEVVCANCHRKRTVARGQWGGRYSLSE